MCTTTLIYSKPFGLGFPFIKLTESAVLITCVNFRSALHSPKS